MHLSPPVIEVDDLTCRYGSFIAVEHLTFHVKPGELYALLGTNGAGKTTTLETLEGHRAPDEGAVTVLSGTPTDRRNVRPRVGMMLQESGFAGDLTVAETIDLFGKLSSRNDNTEHLLKRVDLMGKARVRVAQLSGGEKRRLDFATAIYGGPELLFLDEPTNALDPTARDRLWSVIDDLRARGTTIVLTTHYLEEAEAHADRIGLMHQGRLTHEGTLEDLVAAFPARINFESPLIPDDLPVRPTIVKGEDVTIETHDLQHDLHELLSWAEDNAIELRRLSASPSSLAHVFRSLSADTEPPQASEGKF